MLFHLPLVLSFAGTVLATPQECSRNNCIRAVGGTRIPGHTVTASRDCSRILQSTIIPSAITVYSNFTVTKTIGKAKRATTPAAAIPTYATNACEDLAEYSSACSCLGVTGGIVTASATTITVAKTTTITASGTGGTITPSPPACMANVKIDPLNCGKCGIVCPSGVCSNGVCSSEACNAQVCGGFTNCNPKNTECFCFSSVEKIVDKITGKLQNIGFCGQNAVCSSLTPCKKSEDCNVKGSTGNVCAVDTCCGEAGICLVGQCGNPARKLMRMALAGTARNKGTAAF